MCPVIRIGRLEILHHLRNFRAVIDSCVDIRNMQTVVIENISILEMSLQQVYGAPFFPNIRFAQIEDVNLRQIRICGTLFQIDAVDHRPVKPGAAGMVDCVQPLDFQIVQLPRSVLCQHVQNGIAGICFGNPVPAFRTSFTFRLSIPVRIRSTYWQAGISRKATDIKVSLIRVRLRIFSTRRSRAAIRLVSSLMFYRLRPLSSLS